MKIAVSGAHWTGKTTLVEELCRALPDHSFMNEPYYLLEEKGHKANIDHRDIHEDVNKGGKKL